jgi:hypothetical protein
MIGARLILLLFLIVSFLFSACEEKEEKIEKQIVGTWKIDQCKSTYYTADGIFLGEENRSDLGLVEFYKNGKGTDLDGNFVGSEFVWETKNDTLKITVDNSPILYNIKEHSNSNLELGSNREDEMDLDGDNEQDTILKKEHWFFKKNNPK